MTLLARSFFRSVKVLMLLEINPLSMIREINGSVVDADGCESEFASFMCIDRQTSEF